MARDIRARRGGDPEGLCTVPASPELKARMERARAEAQAAIEPDTGLPGIVVGAEPRRPGLNDGLIIPGDQFPLGTSVERVRRAAAERAPLRGTVRIIVVLVSFADQPFAIGHDTAHYTDLFFSIGKVETGSVREFYAEASHGIVDLDGVVVGPYLLPHSMAEYANGESGVGDEEPNARTVARDALLAAAPELDFAPFDNDDNGFVDAFVVVHAGAGAEQTGDTDDIWSHKWVLPNGAREVDGTKVYAYLTVPEDCRVGVCAHELGHLLFGWPDLYDADYTSEGVGNWCIMGGGSWNGAGHTPAHPSAWCKAQQGWVSVVTPTAGGPLSLADVKDAPHQVIRLWKDGGEGTEYFLVENRQRDRFDAGLPGAGLLIWHIDDTVASNTDESHYKVALVQADGRLDLETDANRGDPGDPFPGRTGNTSFTATSNPGSTSYGGVETCVEVTDIGPSGPVMEAIIAVTCNDDDTPATNP
jgi:immune inhibitor A